MTFTSIELTESDTVAELAFKTPYIDRSVMFEMNEAIKQISDNSRVNALVLKGRPGIFSNGFRFRDFAEGRPMEVVDFNRWEKLINSLHNIDKVTVAMVDGVCAGAGVQVMLACDLRIASKSSIFSHNEIASGYLPGTSVLQLGKYCGAGRALELIQSGSQYSARHAFELGLITDCVDDLSTSLTLRLKQYAHLKPRLHGMVRRLVREAFEMPYNDFLGCCLAAQHIAIVREGDKSSMEATECRSAL